MIGDVDMTIDERSKLIYDYKEYIEKMIHDEFYTEDFLKFLAEELGYEVIKKEEENSKINEQL